MSLMVAVFIISCCMIHANGFQSEDKKKRWNEMQDEKGKGKIGVEVIYILKNCHKM